MPTTAGTQKKLLALSVRIDVLNSTKLKKFSFQIDKTIPAPDQEKWSILFDLLERDKKSEEFPAEPTIHVTIDVSLANVAKTEKTALADDFTVKQTQHVVTVLAGKAAQLKAGEITQEEFNAAVEATMAKR
jgi:hypothetical protein